MQLATCTLAALKARQFPRRPSGCPDVPDRWQRKTSFCSLEGLPFENLLTVHSTGRLDQAFEASELQDAAAERRSASPRTDFQAGPRDPNAESLACSVSSQRDLLVTQPDAETTLAKSQVVRCSLSVHLSVSKTYR